MINIYFSKILYLFQHYKSVPYKHIVYNINFVSECKMMTCNVAPFLLFLQLHDVSSTQVPPPLLLSRPRSSVVVLSVTAVRPFSFLLLPVVVSVTAVCLFSSLLLPPSAVDPALFLCPSQKIS